MSKYSSVQAVLRREGGHGNDPDDPGKETYCGISRRYQPTWKGWAFVDSKNWAMAKTWVQDFYNNYWDDMKVDSLLDPMLQESVFDYGVNTSPKHAVKKLQRTLKYMGKKSVADDGKIGPATAKACSDLFCAGKGNELLRMYAGKKSVDYCEKVIAAPVKRKFLFGWLLRAWEQVR